MYARILKLAGQGAVYGLGSVASKLLAIVLLPIVISYIKPTQYGIAELVTMLVLFSSAFLRLGMQNAMMRFFYDTPEDERDELGVRVVRTALGASLVSLAIGSLVMLALAHPLAEFFLKDPRRDEFIWLAVLGLWASVVYSTLTATFRLEQRPGAFLKVSLGNILASAALTLFFITELKWGVEGLLLGNYLGYLVMVPIAGLMQRRYVVPMIDRKLVRAMLRFAVPTIPIAIAFQALTLIDRTILSKTVGLDEVGVYGLAARFAGVVLIVVTALQLSWQPFAYSIKDDDEARRSYAIVTTWFAAGMGWIVSGMALLADPMVRALAEPVYYDAIALVPLLALAAGIYGGYFLVGIGASRVKKTGWHAAVAGGAVMVSLIANLLLVPAYGAQGAAVAAVLANTSLVVFMLVRSQRVFRVDYELLRMARPALLTGLAIAAAYSLPTGTGFDSWASRWALALAWPLLLVASGFVTRPERERIVRLVRRRRGAEVA